MIVTINEIEVNLGKVINMVLKRDTSCAKCTKKIEKSKRPLFLGGFGYVHDKCYKELVREHANA